MSLSYRLEVEESKVVVYIDSDSVSWIEQPFNPNTKEDWSSEEEASFWADSWINSYNNRPEPTPL